MGLWDSGNWLQKTALLGGLTAFLLMEFGGAIAMAATPFAYRYDGRGGSAFKGNHGFDPGSVCGMSGVDGNAAGTGRGKSRQPAAVAFIGLFAPGCHQQAGSRF